MSTIGVILPLHQGLIGKHDRYIGVDAGALYIVKHQLEPFAAVGDFDSCSTLEFQQILDYFVTIEKHCSIKDETDTALALKQIDFNTVDQVVVYGAFQMRFDHALANYHLLMQYPAKLCLCDQYNYVFKLEKGNHSLINCGYQYCSFFAINDCHLTLKGFKYPLDNYCLKRFENLAISNQLLDAESTVMCDSELICIQSRDI